LIRLAVRCSPELADRVLAELVELVPGGVEEERGPDWVEYAIYVPPGELPELPELRAAAGEGLVAVETTEVPDDWADRWRDFHRPVAVGERLVVRPSWEAGAAARAEIEIVVDPGRAFGTGAHATTRMCLELLLALADRGEAAGPLADLGTGSGVLAIAADRLGFDPVTAWDHQPAAVEAARANARLNGAEVAVERLDLREALPPLAPVWVANLTAPLLGEIAARLGAAGEGRPRLLLLSGLLVSERERLCERFSAAGYEPRERRRDGEWAALLLERV
jgi:ribosomal protein L11 methyltransferase